MHSEHSLTDNDQQKATEKPNQDGQQEIKKEKQKQKYECTTDFFLSATVLVYHQVVCLVSVTWLA